jgi:hypothetical protein
MTEVTRHYHRFVNGHKGKLLKQGVVFKNWRPHYFVLEKKRFRYYDEAGVKLAGEFTIDSSSTQIFDVSGEMDGRKYVFYLKGKSEDNNEELLYMAASSESEKSEWIEALYDAIHEGLKLVYQPELWAQPFFPASELSVQYPDSGVAIENGNIIRPFFTEFVPRVSFRASNNDKHSLLLIDFDSIVVKTVSEDKIKLMWGVVNFSGSDLSTGDEVCLFFIKNYLYLYHVISFFFF